MKSACPNQGTSRTEAVSAPKLTGGMQGSEYAFHTDAQTEDRRESVDKMQADAHASVMNEPHRRIVNSIRRDLIFMPFLSLGMCNWLGV